MARLTMIFSPLALIAAAAQAMTVDDFVTRSEKLQSKGMLAIVSSEYGALKDAFDKAFMSYNAELKATNDKGSARLGCPPPKIGINSNEFVASLKQVVPAPARAKTDFKDGVLAYMRHRFPCPAGTR